MTAVHTKLGEIMWYYGRGQQLCARNFPTLVDVYSVGVRARSHMTCENTQAIISRVLPDFCCIM